MITLTPGVRYRVVHQTDAQRYPRESVMDYLGTSGDEVTRDDDELSFSARPFAGTQQFRADQIISATAVPKDTEVYMNLRA